MTPTILKGLAMGLAEVIPGVSGGTIAFITGIYERLLNCIKAFNPSLINIYRHSGIKGIWEAIDGNFLFFLVGGMALGVVSGIFGVTYLLEEYPAPLWGFFFGLILASSVYIGSQISSWPVTRWIYLVLGFVIAYGITLVAPVEGSTHPLIVFLAGVIAISALILPGISGSFMLLLMGMYTIIIPSLKSLIRDRSMDSFWIVAVFGAGCIVGLTGFSRVLTWLLNHYKSSTFAVLTGFMLGSLNKIWPWRNITEILNKENGVAQKIFDPATLQSIDPDTYKILSESNVLPQGYLMGDALTLITIVSAILGVAIVYFLDRSQKTT